MPDRLIRESWCASETIDRLTPFEETVLARLIVNCDDFGRMDGRTNVLCSRLFVTRRDVGAEQMRAAIAALEREGLVLRYAVAGKEYIQMRGWGEHQRIRTQRSKYPAPPDAAEASRGISLAYHAADALPNNAESGQAVLPAGALPEGTAAGQAALPQAGTGAAMRTDHVAAHVSPTQTADAGQAAEMLPGNAGNAQAALPGGNVWGDPAGGGFGAHGNAPAESHPYSMAGSVQVPPGAMPGQSGAQANFAIARPAAECRDLPHSAAECSDLPQPAAERNRLRLESESNPNPNPNPNRNPTRSRKSNLHTIPAAPAGATEGARAREAFSEFWENIPKRRGAPRRSRRICARRPICSRKRCLRPWRSNAKTRTGARNGGALFRAPQIGWPTTGGRRRPSRPRQTREAPGRPAGGNRSFCGWSMTQSRPFCGQNRRKYEPLHRGRDDGMPLLSAGKRQDPDLRGLHLGEHDNHALRKDAAKDGLAGGNLRAVPFPALPARQCGRDEVRTVRRRKRGKAMRL